MSEALILPIFRELIPAGLSFSANYLVEFEPQSLWYETSLTIAAQAARLGMLTDYHTFQHVPNDVRKALVGLGLNIGELEERDSFRMMDSYTRMTVGQDVLEKTKKTREVAHFYEPYEGSLDLKDWETAVKNDVKDHLSSRSIIKNRALHIDDNNSVLLQYNSEKAFIDFWRTYIVPSAKISEFTFLHSILTGVHTEGFYRQFESLCDGIIDFKSPEEQGQLEHYIRVRSIHGRLANSSWRRLHLQNNGEVYLDAKPINAEELGIRRWLRGQK